MQRDYRIAFDAGSARQAAVDINALAAAIGALNAQNAILQQNAARAAQALNGIQAPAQQGAQAVESFGAQMLALRAGMLVVQEVKGLLESAGTAARKLNETKLSEADKGLRMRDQARELANLFGKPEADDEVMSRIFDVAKQSGFNFGETVKYLEQFEGSVPAAVKKGHVREDQKQELAVEGARAALRFGLDPATGGDLAGVIGQHVDLNDQTDAKGNKMSAREALASQIEGLVYASNEGRGKVSVLVRNEMAQAANALASGRIGGLAEIGGFVGTASTLSKTGAFSGTLFSQLDNALNRVGDKAGDFLKESGVAAEHGDRAKLGKLKEVVDAARLASADPERFDVNAFLSEHGFGSQVERKSLTAFMANTEVLDKTTAEAEKRSKDGAAAVRSNERYQTSLLAQYRKGEVAEEEGAYQEGRANQPAVAARAAAEGRLKREGRNTAFTNFAETVIDGSFLGKAFMGQSFHDQRVDDEAFQILAEQAQKAGIDLAKRFPGQVGRVDAADESSRTGLTRIGHLTSEGLSKMIESVEPELRQKGLGFTGVGEGAGELKGAAADLKEAAKALKDGAAGGKGRPAPGGGDPPQVGGIGFNPRRG